MSLITEILFCGYCVSQTIYCVYAYYRDEHNKFMNNSAEKRNLEQHDVWMSKNRGGDNVISHLYGEVEKLKSRLDVHEAVKEYRVKAQYARKTK